MERSSFTECCVGLVLISPAVAMKGTRVRCISSARELPISTLSCRAASRKGSALDVTDGAADLDHRHVGIAGAEEDASLDLVGDVRDHLYRAAKIVAATLLGEHLVVDAPGGEVIAPGHYVRG
jgi:hypothetical protein